VLILSACASSDTRTGGVYDPFEEANRAVFKVNNVLDDAIAKPIAKGYRYVLPEPARVGVRNVLRNLNSPVNIGNQLLQGDVAGAGNDVGRAVINSTIGIGGLFDVAGYMGLKYESEDFGQTLGKWGVTAGPYFIIPVLGPSNLRDSTGRVVDNYADPLRHYLFNTDQEDIYYARAGVSLIDQREAVLDVLETMEQSSIDYYAVMRSSYDQYRKAQIRDEDPGVGGAVIPDYESE
jgi:phospholipid-binding lipoprotein MlaA